MKFLSFVAASLVLLSVVLPGSFVWVEGSSPTRVFGKFVQIDGYRSFSSSTHPHQFKHLLVFVCFRYLLGGAESLCLFFSSAGARTSSTS